MEVDADGPANVMVLITGEPFQPVRLHYRVLDQAALRRFTASRARSMYPLRIGRCGFTIMKQASSV
jgi:hypothetical protein